MGRRQQSHSVPTGIDLDWLSRTHSRSNAGKDRAGHVQDMCKDVAGQGGCGKGRLPSTSHSLAYCRKHDWMYRAAALKSMHQSLCHLLHDILLLSGMIVPAFFPFFFIYSTWSSWMKGTWRAWLASEPSLTDPGRIFWYLIVLYLSPLIKLELPI